MLIDIIFLGAIGALWSWINSRVREDSGGRYGNWLDAVLDGLDKAEESLRSADTWVQLIFGPLIGIFRATAEFLDGVIRDLTGATDSVGDYLSDIFDKAMEEVYDKIEDNEEKIRNLYDLIYDYVDEKIPDIEENIENLRDEMHDVVEEKLNQTIQNQSNVIDKLKESIDEQIDQTKKITTDINYLLEDHTTDSFADMEALWNDIMNKALENLYDAETVADTYLNRDIFNTTMQMNMWADLFEAATTIDEEKARENLKKQLAVYKDLYFEALKQYKEIAESIRPEMRRGV